MAFLQAPVFLLQVVKPECAVDGQGKQFRLERLGEKVVSPQADGPQGIAVIVLAGQDNHLGVRGGGEDFLEQAETFGNRVGIGRQSEIHRHDGGRVAVNLHQRAFTISGGQCFVLIE